MLQLHLSLNIPIIQFSTSVLRNSTLYAALAQGCFLSFTAIRFSSRRFATGYGNEGRTGPDDSVPESSVHLLVTELVSRSKQSIVLAAAACNALRSDSVYEQKHLVSLIMWQEMQA